MCMCVSERNSVCVCVKILCTLKYLKTRNKATIPGPVQSTTRCKEEQTNSQGATPKTRVPGAHNLKDCVHK